MSASQSERGTMADFRTVVAFGAARRITSPAAEVPSVRVRRHPGDLARRGRVPPHAPGAPPPVRHSRAAGPGRLPNLVVNAIPAAYSFTAHCPL